MPPPTTSPIIPAVLDQADLETIVGVVRLPQLILRAGEDSTVFARRVAEIAQRATDHAAGILYRAWGTDQIIKIFASDYSVWCDVRDLGAGYCGLYQTELVDPETGVYPFSMQWKQANKNLHDRVDGKPRIVAEAAVGVNKTINTRIKRRPPTTIFGDGHGGF